MLLFSSLPRVTILLAAIMTTEEFFPTVPQKIPYKGPDSKDPLSYRHYNPDEVILGKPMKEWLRFSVCWWHTFTGGGGQDPFGAKTLLRPWEDGITDPIELAKRRVDAAFELFTKLGVEYYTFHDVDVAPEGNSLEEFQSNLDVISDYLLQKQKETGVKLLWSTQNLFTHPRYMNGAGSNPNVHVFCYAAAQVQKMLDINHKLSGASHVFWGGREGYQVREQVQVYFVVNPCSIVLASLSLSHTHTRTSFNKINAVPLEHGSKTRMRSYCTFVSDGC